jgi:membrane protease YdiL (CAAX protease family)
MPEEHAPSNDPLAHPVAGEVPPGASILSVSTESEPLPGDSSEPMRSKRTWKEGLGEIAEVCLVILVVLGGSIFSSVYPLFRAANEPGAFWGYAIARLLLPCAAGLALFVYFLSPVGGSGSGSNALLPAAGGAGASPRSFFPRAGHGLRRGITVLGLVVLFAFGPDFLAEVSSWLDRFVDSAMVSRNLRHLVEVLHDAIGLGFLWHVLHRRGRSFSDLGLDWRPGAVALVFPLFLVGVLMQFVIAPLTFWMGETLSQPGWHPPDISSLLFGREVRVAAVPGNLINGFFEELIVRAFVMTGVMRLTRHTWVAVVVSVAIQTSYHFYQGVPLALSHIPLFTMYSIFYAKTRSILPLALAHALVDLHSLWRYSFQTALS